MTIEKEDFKKTPDQLEELIGWRAERSNFWTAFAKQTKNNAMSLNRLRNANLHAKEALDLRAEALNRFGIIVVDKTPEI